MAGAPPTTVEGTILKPLSVHPALTVRSIVVVFVNAPFVPVIARVAGPTTALSLAVRISFVDVVAVAGLKEAVTPVGRPLT